jgi:hypothetical protein
MRIDGTREGFASQVRLSDAAPYFHIKINITENQRKQININPSLV